MRKCFPYKISSRGIIKGQAVFHAHISIGYSDCSKTQNYEYGKERNMQTKLSAMAFSGKALSYKRFLLCQGCGICCIWSVQFLRTQMWNMTIFFPIFRIFSISQGCTLAPASLSSEIMEIGVNLNLIFFQVWCFHWLERSKWSSAMGKKPNVRQC